MTTSQNPQPIRSATLHAPTGDKLRVVSDGGRLKTVIFKVVLDTDATMLILISEISRLTPLVTQTVHIHHKNRCFEFYLRARKTQPLRCCIFFLIAI
jgi:hypothetical protein